MTERFIKALDGYRTKIADAIETYGADTCFQDEVEAMAAEGLALKSLRKSLDTDANEAKAIAEMYYDLVPQWEDVAIHDDETFSMTVNAAKDKPFKKRYEIDRLRAAEKLASGDPFIDGNLGGSKRSLVTAFSDVQYTPPEFLVSPYIPVGKITIMQGDPSAGKTAVACSIAAHVSTGAPICGHACKQRPVLLLSYEDDAPILRGRLEANGADLGKVFFCDKSKLNDWKQEDEETILTFTDSRIEEMVKETGAGLVIFDPMQLFFGADVDMFRPNETRPVMEHLRGMAERNNCAVIIIAHLNKQGGKSKAMYRALGSMDIPAAARSVIHIGRDPDNKENRVAIHVKSSNERDGESLAFEIGERGKVTWKGASPLTYEDIERAASRKQYDGIDYEDEPLVKVFRRLIVDNPGGVFVTNAELFDYGQELLNYPPAPSSNKLGEKIRGLQYELKTRDHILATPCKKRPTAFMRFGKPYGGRGAAAYGVEIRQYTPQQEAYQQALSTM